ncbi:MAG: VWA domain-containing protein [Bacteroidales bacterium]|nr:VWA domain-containing protein [Bacteroidales bacterium]
MSLFRFENPDVLYWLFAIIAIVTIIIVVEFRRKQKIDKIGDKKMVDRLLSGTSAKLRITKYILFVFVYVLLIIGLANPQVGSKVETVERKGVDLVVALDISNSMLAEDIKPSRLERAKQAISTLLDNMKNDRIGLVVFAGKAYQQLPLTSDYGAVKLILSTVNPSFIDVQGTALADAIDIAASSFNESNHSKAIIVITDGENHIGDAVASAKKAAQAGIKVHTIGIGLLDGTPIPVVQNGRNIGYRKDKNGATVVTKLDENTLIKVAEAGDGSYVRANTARVGLKKIFDDINKMDATVFDTKKVTDYKDEFQYFVGAALLLFVIMILLPNRTYGRFNVNKLLSKHAAVFLFLLLLPVMAVCQNPRHDARRGNTFMKKGDFQKAEIKYRKALETDPLFIEAEFNLGNSLYEEENYQDAAISYMSTAERSKDNKQKALSYYNLGNSMYNTEKYPEALEAYKQSLRLDPNNNDARYNMLMTKKKLDQNGQQNNSNRDQQNQDQQNQDQQNQDQQNQDQQQQDQQNQDQQQDQQNQDQQQGQQGDEQQGEEMNISKEDAERMLEAMKSDEKKTLMKVQEQKTQGKKIKIDKDW